MHMHIVKHTHSNAVLSDPCGWIWKKKDNENVTINNLQKTTEIEIEDSHLYRANQYPRDIVAVPRAS